MSRREEYLAMRTDTGDTVYDVAKRLVQPKHPWLIDPRKSKIIGYWDVLTSVCTELG